MSIINFAYFPITEPYFTALLLLSWGYRGLQALPAISCYVLIQSNMGCAKGSFRKFNVARKRKLHKYASVTGQSRPVPIFFVNIIHYFYWQSAIKSRNIFFYFVFFFVTNCKGIDVVEIMIVHVFSPNDFRHKRKDDRKTSSSRDSCLHTNTISNLFSYIYHYSVLVWRCLLFM